MIDKSEAVSIARRLLLHKGIKLFGNVEIKRIDGALRKNYLPAKVNDYWLVTFQRLTALVDSSPHLGAEDLEILAAVAEESDSVTVAVEMDGTATVV